MPKNLKLWMLSAMVSDGKTHEVDEALEKAGASHVMWRPQRSDRGEQLPAKVTNGTGSTVARSRQQVAWLDKNIPKGGASFQVADLLDSWQGAGFRREGIYGALIMAVANKLVKKLGPGKYRRIG